MFKPRKAYYKAIVKRMQFQRDFIIDVAYMNKLTDPRERYPRLRKLAMAILSRLETEDNFHYFNYRIVGDDAAILATLINPKTKLHQHKGAAA